MRSELIITAFSIHVFLPDGDANGVRIVTKSHWSGIAIMCSRTEYFKASGREEFHRTGLYVLVGPSPDGTGRDHVYVGEGDDVHKRITAHDLKKEFWTDVVVFTKTDSSLNKADVRYLEARLVEIAKQYGIATLDNTALPAPPLPTESHKADVESFLQDIRTILALLGVNAFRSGSAAGAAEQSAETLTFSMGGASGKLKMIKDGYQLLAGPGILKADKASIGKTYQALRQKMIEEGRLIPDPDNDHQLRLTEDTPFRSPSAAAAVVYGGNVNGRTAWRNAQGQTLADLEAVAAKEF